MPVIFPNISFASINCNSLNISSIGSFNQKLKIYGIVSLKTDIIIMSDIRLCNAQGVSSSGEMATAFRLTPYGSYKFLHNSNLNKRGVGVLIRSTSSISVLKEWRDGHDNVLGLQLEREGKKFNVIAIYGPNHVQANFFTDIRACIAALGNCPLVMGGDWNCTYSTAPPATNIDIFKMANAPNLNHSKLFKKMCDDLELCDPFRTKFPNRLDFTYRPSNLLKKNRSRIDFFIISRNLVNLVTDIENKGSLQNKHFDHMAILLSFIPKRKAPSPPHYL
jgi:exonuclease III